MVCRVFSSLCHPTMLSSQKHLLTYGIRAFLWSDAGLAMTELPSINAPEFMATKSSTEIMQQTWQLSGSMLSIPVAKITLWKLSLYIQPYFQVIV